MPIEFFSPSYRASNQDLTVAISPLGLVELADEEFEVHGPRLNRYSSCWAWYLGHHWSHRREMGEPQITLNYIRTLSDYITNFTYGKGVQFRCPEQNAAVIPHLLDKVWTTDNNKAKILWEMGQLSGVTGDCFVKVAYEEPWIDPIGVIHPGRVRIIPINPAFAFPEYHPHDKDRLLRFKLKYRYWGTAPEGTRQVFTFTEIITDDAVEMYINDELVDAYPNPVGVIPIVHLANISISPSPWGQSDIYDIISLNREMNEKMTEISDIVNYHSAPVTIVTGAKPANLEKGARKMWTIPNEKANVFNLESSGDMAGAMEYVAFLKRTMHEMTGVPETALGQVQPISNTSGVALAIQYQPMMSRYNMKKIHASKALEQINALIIRTKAVHEPESLVWNEGSASQPEIDQAMALDPTDPLTYQTSCHWPEPLPVDAMAKLAEIQQKMLMGIESKRSAMAELGEAFPNEKLAEIYEELIDDAYDQGAIDFVHAKVASAIMAMTGQIPTGDGGSVPADVTSAGDQKDGMLPPPPPVDPDTVNQIVSRAYGANLAQRRVPDDD